MTMTTKGVPNGKLPHFEPPMAGFIITANTPQANVDESQSQSAQKSADERAGSDLGSSSSSSARAFATSLALLAAYTFAGAYMYSNWAQVRFMDALFTCFEALSGVQLPDLDSLTQLQFDRKRLKQLAATPTSSQQNKLQMLKSNALLERELTASMRLAIVAAYLAIGWHLASMCAHFAKLWLESSSAEISRAKGDSDSDADDYAAKDSSSNNNNNEDEEWPATHLMVGSISGQPASSSTCAAVPHSSQQFDCDSGELVNVHKQIDLSELYVLNQPAPTSCADERQVSLASQYQTHGSNNSNGSHLHSHCSEPAHSVSDGTASTHGQVLLCGHQPTRPAYLQSHHSSSSAGAISADRCAIYNEQPATASSAEQQQQMGRLLAETCLMQDAAQLPGAFGGLNPSASLTRLHIDPSAGLQNGYGAHHQPAGAYHSIARRHRPPTRHLNGCPAASGESSFAGSTGTSGAGTGASCEQSQNALCELPNANTASTQMDLTLTASNTSNTMSSISSRVVQQVARAQAQKGGASSQQQQQQQPQAAPSPRISFVLPAAPNGLNNE